MQTQPRSHSADEVRNQTAASVPSAVVLLALVLGLALGGCGASGDEPSGGSTGQQPDAQQGQQGPGGANFPGAVGEIADVSGHTLQVQGANEQVAVRYTDSTTITETVDGSTDDLKVGVCVAVQSDSQQTGQGQSDDRTADDVTATTVTVSQPTKKDTCTAGFGGGFGGTNGNGRNRGNGPPDGQLPSPPADGPTPPQGQRGFGGIPANGIVTTVDGDSFVVKVATPAINNQDGEDDGQSTPATQTTNVTVTTTSDTTWAKEVDGDADALVTGACVTALGTADDTGAIAADSIAVRPKEGDSCALAGMPNGQPGAGSGSQDGSGGGNA